MPLPGGGTTDLTSGRFRIENNRVSYIIDLETRYENGDTNLGGNNLTYRILQLLKLRLTEELGFQTKEAFLNISKRALILIANITVLMQIYIILLIIL